MTERITIPGTDISVFPIGLGTVGAGLDWDGAEADRIFELYLELGGNLIDTAHVYNDWVKPEIARSERVVGDWLSRSGKRGEVILMTKGGHPDMTCDKPDMRISRMTRADMISDLEASLKQLRTDYIDVYFYHRDDIRQPVSELIEVMEEFVKAGKIRWYACSNWKADRMRQADGYCREKGYRGFVANQALLNIGLEHMKPMSDDTMEAFDGAMLDYHSENFANLAMPYMGVCGGFFHSFIESGSKAVENSNYYTPGNLEVAKRVERLMKEYNASVSQVLLRFFFNQSFPCAPLYGPQNEEQLRDAMQTVRLSF